MNLKILSTALCRTPLFSYRDNIEEVWEELKEAIKISSEEFYGLIKDINSDEIAHLPLKLKFSCWKYFNRARFRATPFGPFGSITLLRLTAEQQGTITLQQRPSLTHFTDWHYKDHLTNDIERLYDESQHLVRNASIYNCGNQLRYISITAENLFEISSIANQQIVEYTLNLCKTPINKHKIIDALAQQYQLQAAIIKDFLKQLIALQLVITDLHPNIIGTDYFKRIAIKPKTSTDSYIISKRKLIKGQLNPQGLKIVAEAVNFLKDYLPKAQQTTLDVFKKQFQEKFEYQEVPLLQALDPELGVGYGDLASSPETDNLVEILKNNRPSENQAINIPYTALHQFLLNSIIKQEEVKLERLNRYQQMPNKAVFPNTLSAMVQLVDDLVILEHAGGATANALLGRFTLENSLLTDHCKQIAHIEQQANPGVIFFDIAYQAEKKIDNINRREAIYTYELPILSWPGSSKVLSLQDISISVKDNEVVLRSVKSGKRLIPRLSTAYNYSRSDLAIYRFLCDLQHQGLQTNIGINLKNIFPDLDYYPRLSYKNLVLSPRMWKVPHHFHKKNSTTALADLKNWLQKNNVSKQFKCGYHDQFLWFDCNQEQDLLFFLMHCKNKEDVYITEAFTPVDGTLKNEREQPYLGEYIINLYHNEPIYQPLNPDYALFHQHDESTILPGQDWLYFEIYCHPSRSNVLLTHAISTYIKQMQMAKYIKKWFFIRYPIPVYHIRLRVQLKNPKDLSKAITLLSDLLEADIKSGLVTDLQIKPYRRETERYGLQEIEVVEKCFNADSKYILRLLHRKINQNTAYLLIMRLLGDLLTELKIDEWVTLSTVRESAGYFAKEHAFGGREFKKINGTYSQLLQEASPLLTKTLDKSYRRTLRAMVSSMEHLAQPRKLQLMRDFIHMHINRLFTTDQRMHEAVIYQYYLKQLMAKQKRSI